MCLICVDLAKNSLTALEALRNLNEMVVGKDLDNEQQTHAIEVLSKIKKLEEDENWQDL